MPVETRPYNKKRRAELEAETRRRITETAVELHGTVGPARTSISAIAERAGVRRSTVYRHFPDEETLFAACSSHWAAANPLPDLERWTRIDDPDERLHSALDELYAFYGRTEQMMENLLRDEETLPVVKRLFSVYHDYLTAAREILVSGRPERGRRRDAARVAIGHALAFATWKSLAREQGLDDSRAADLMCAMVSGAAER